MKTNQTVKAKTAAPEPKQSGRQPIWMDCPGCGQTFKKIELRKHEPDCRRKHFLVPGAQFTIYDSNEKKIPVTVLQHFKKSDRTLVRSNLTGIELIVISPRRFHEWMEHATEASLRK